MQRWGPLLSLKNLHLNSLMLSQSIISWGLFTEPIAKLVLNLSYYSFPDLWKQLQDEPLIKAPLSLMGRTQNPVHPTTFTLPHSHLYLAYLFSSYICHATVKIYTKCILNYFENHKINMEFTGQVI
jgi:hypothetical protein